MYNFRENSGFKQNKTMKSRVPYSRPHINLNNELNDQMFPDQDFHEDFDKEVKLSLVDTAEVDEQRRTLEETWDIHK